MTDQLSIANRALLSVGARAQISSLSPSDGSPEGNAVTTLWQPTFEALARTAQWNCLRQQVTLSLLAAASGTPENVDGTTLPSPPQPWLYQYAYPSDALTIRWIVPSLPSSTGSSVPSTTISNAAGTWLPNGGQIQYQISQIKDVNNSPILIILTNQSQAQAVYTVNQPNPAAWDSLFQAAMVASLGAFLVPALSLSMPLMQLAIKTAEMAIAQARAVDGNEGVTSMDHLPDWMAARAGAQGYGWGDFTTYGGQCFSMTWPGGLSGGYYG